MKKIAYVFLSVFVLISTLTNSQNVGINSTGAVADASAGLDVSFTDKGFLAPKVALTAANTAGPITLPATGLLVYNTATAGAGQNQVWPGYYYNRGTPASPFWVKFDGKMTFHSSSTSGVTLNSNGVVTVIPGTAISITIPTGLTADIYINAYAGFSLDAILLSNYAIGDLIIYKNGGFLTFGGWNRIETSGYNRMLTTSINSRDLNVASGTHTYDLRGNRFNGNRPLTIGNDCATQVSCAEMTIEVIFK